MAYAIDRFGIAYESAAVLPVHNARQPQGTASVESTLLDLPWGGAFDWRGADHAQTAVDTRSISGLIVTATEAELLGQLNLWRALVGTKSRLWRSDNGADRQWRMARCLGLTSELIPRARNQADVSLRFELPPGPWQGAARSETILLDTSPKSQAVTNGGNVVQRDVVLTVTAVGSPITALWISNFLAEHNARIHYTGAIAAGQSLVIDCGAGTVRNHGVDDYAQFVLEAGHRLSLIHI